MRRRDFAFNVPVALASFAIAGCRSAPMTTEQDRAQRRRVIDSDFFTTLARLDVVAPQARQIVNDARGILIFPTVVSVSAIMREQHGDGALRVANSTDRYYSMSFASLDSPESGLQTVAQTQAIILLFMTQKALDEFRVRPDWTIGRDAAVASIVVDSNDTYALRPVAPVQAIVMARNTLIPNPELDGITVSPLDL